MDSKKLPDSLVATRPALADDYTAQHPANGSAVGPVPTRYSRALHDAICENIKEGNRSHVAAQMAGLPQHTFYQWMRAGREGDVHLWEFARDVELAEGCAEGSMVKVIKEASKTDVDAAKFWLERGRSAGWSKQVQQLVNGQLEEFMNRLEAGLPPDVFQLVLNVAVGQTARGIIPKAIVVNDDSDQNDS